MKVYQPPYGTPSTETRCDCCCNYCCYYPVDRPTPAATPSLLSAINSTSSTVNTGEAVPFGELRTRSGSDVSQAGNLFVLNSEGIYKVTWSAVISAQSVTGGAQTVGVAVYLNGSEYPGSVRQATFTDTTSVQTIGGSEIVSVPTGSATVQIMNTGVAAVIQKASITIEKLGNL